MSPPFAMEQLTLAAKSLIHAVGQNHSFVSMQIRLPSNYIKGYKTTKWNRNHNCNPFWSSISLSIRTCFLFYFVCYFHVVEYFERLLVLCFTQLVGSSRCLNFDQSRDKTPAFNKVSGQGWWNRIIYVIVHIVSLVAAKTGDSKLLLHLISKRIIGSLAQEEMWSVLYDRKRSVKSPSSTMLFVLFWEGFER